MIRLLESHIRDHWDDFNLPFVLPTRFLFLFVKGFRKTIFFLFKDNNSQPFAVLKISDDPVVFERLESEYETLSYLFAKKTMTRNIPAPLAFFEMRGHKCVFESALGGTPLVYSIKGIRTRRGLIRMREIFTCVVDSLIALHSPSSPHEKDKKKQVVVEHGDFNPSNLYISRSGIKIFDWEYSTLHGVPMRDLLDFSLKYVLFARYLAKEVRREQPVLNDFEEAFLAGTTHSQIIWENLNRYGDRMDLSRSSKRDIFSIFVRKYLDEHDARACREMLDILL
ncbi:MAG: hypothetical protein A2Z08_09210 [Deltaproteobacteria bacterium RBG_16_54_11]|jgi:serine/threonine protein kinase|nr:MAG: hypothetical protein A2Z08_09210 [Deltaproteobacteria bacterium RBG_16_54_11]